ncbi:GNAT family N-acetyltransferase [Neorhodopirellula lusitana]|uniref:GNAT family N-acetyltransferase n=1 Tax=Neorhodopirellula lusitana TaxID=445327 RepID=UPI00384C220C
MASITIRNAVPSQDAEDACRVYSHFVLNSSATFEEIPPTVSAMEALIRTTQDQRYPFLIAEVDGHFAGYASAKLFYGRSGFSPTVEDSIYLDPAFHGQGVGHYLLGELVDRCRQRGIRNILALIGGGPSNVGSTRLHEKHGFFLVGNVEKCGRKNGELRDMSILQLVLDS